MKINTHKIYQSSKIYEHKQQEKVKHKIYEHKQQEKVKKK